SVDRFNIPLAADGPTMPAELIPGHYEDLFVIAQGIPDMWQELQKDPGTPWICGVFPPKIMARPTKIGGVTPGLHDIIESNEPLQRVRARDLFIAHLPFTTRTRFECKVNNIQALFAEEKVDIFGDDAWQNEGDRTGWHWRRWAALASEGRLDEE